MSVARKEEYMASISKHKDKWGVIVHRKHIYKSKVFTTRGYAQTWARKIEQEIDAGIYIDRHLADNMTLSAALDYYVETVSPTKKGGVLNQKKERSCVKQIKRFSLVKLPLSHVKSSDIAKFRDGRAEEVGANSVRLALALISHLFTVAKQEWGMDYLVNPCMGIKKPRVSHTARERRLEDDEEVRLLRAAEEYGGDIPLVIVLAIETAMRRGEIAGIKKGDVNLNAGTVFLPDTKNNTSRYVYLSTKAKMVLADLMKDKNKEDFILNMTSEGIGKAFRRVCRRCKSMSGEHAPIVNLHFHDLRHEATSRLFEKSLSTEEVMSMTGHKTYQCLLRYTHLRPTNLHHKLG